MLVASTTASRPLARRDSRALWSTLNAALRGGLVRLVARHHRPEAVRRQDLVRGEMARRERGLAGPGRPDEDDQAGSAMTISAIAG